MICAYQISKCICSQTSSNFDATIQTFALLVKGDSIFSLRTSLFESQMRNVYREISSTCNWKQTSQSPARIESQNTFFVIQGFLFLFFDWVKWKIFFSFVLFSSREKKRKDNYPYLWQWIIEIFIITQPYELCAKRETKIGMVLSIKLTYFLLVL